MTWTAVARKDFRDARLSKSLWVLTALFVLMSAGFAYLYATIPELSTDVNGVSTVGLLFLLSAPATLFIAIAAIVVAASSIGGERGSGSAKLLLGLPHTRRDVVLGKLVGRTAVLAVAIVTGLVLSLAVVFALYASISLTDYAIFAALTLLLALAYTGLMIGISATTATGGRAIAYGLAAFVVLELLWDAVPFAVYFVVNGFSAAGIVSPPSWIAFLGLLAPTAAYGNALTWFLGTASAGTPFYLTGWASLVVLAGWLIVPLVIGYRRFDRADL